MPWSRNSQRYLDHYHPGLTRDEYMRARAQEITTEEFIQETQAHQARDAFKEFEEHEKPSHRRRRLLRSGGAFKCARIIDPSLDESWYTSEGVQNMTGWDIECRMYARYPDVERPFDFSYVDAGRRGTTSESRGTTKTSWRSAEESPNTVYEDTVEHVEGGDREDVDMERMDVEERESHEGEKGKGKVGVGDEEESGQIGNEGATKREGEASQDHGVVVFNGHLNGKANGTPIVHESDKVANNPDEEMNGTSH